MVLFLFATLLGAAHSQDASNCPLPQGAKWCTVAGTDDYKSFQMAVYSDIVGNTICDKGAWEPVGLSHLNVQKKRMFDIGANVGWYSFVAALQGWNVEAFEPMPMNTEAMEATICANAHFQGNIKIHKVALGPNDSKETCRAFSRDGNIGDASLCCGNSACPDASNPRLKSRGEVPERSLDGMFQDATVDMTPGSIGYVKIDVEGFECAIINGASQSLLKASPEYVLSELNTFHPNACTPEEYLKKYELAGFSVHEWNSGRLGEVVNTDGFTLAPSKCPLYMMQRKVSSDVKRSFVRKVKVHANGLASTGA